MRRSCLLAGLLLVALPAGAQTHRHGAETPVEPGQGAFAAVAEIVALLRADPATDWSRVDLDALTLHLRDMDALMTDLAVSSRALPSGMEFEVVTTGRAGEAAARMFPAHAQVLAAETGWLSQAELREGRIVWTVQSDEDAAVIRALGFFGLMATGAHHPAHHMAIATGQPMH